MSSYLQRIGSGPYRIIHRFHYLKYGLSLVLMVVGAKMLINAAFGKIIPTEAALLVTALLIGGSMLVSVLKTRGLPCDFSGPFPHLNT